MSTACSCPVPRRRRGRRVGLRHQPGHRAAPALADERAAGRSDRQASRTRRFAARWASTPTRALQRVRRRTSACGSRAPPSARTFRGTSPSSTCRRSTRSRCRAATSTSRAASCRSSTDEAELAGVLGHEIGHVTARHAARAVHARDERRTRAACSAASSCPSARPFAELGADRARRAVPEVRPRRRAAGRRARRAVRGARRLGSGGGAARCSRRSAASTRRPIAQGVPNWLSTHPAAGRIACSACRPPSTRPSAGADAVRRRSRRVPAAHRRPGLRRQPGAGHRARHARSCIPTCGSRIDFPDGLARSRTDQTQVMATGARGERGLMLLQVLQRAGASQSLEDAALGTMRRAGFQRDARRARRRSTASTAYRRAPISGTLAGLRTRRRSAPRTSCTAAACFSSPGLRRSMPTYAPIGGRVLGEHPLVPAAQRAPRRTRIRPNRIDLYTARGGRHLAVDRRAAGTAASSKRVDAGDHERPRRSAIRRAPASG